MTSTETASTGTMYRDRCAAVLDHMREAGVSAMILGTGPDLEFFTGLRISSHERLTALVIQTDGEDFLVVPAVDAGRAVRTTATETGITLMPWRDGDSPYELILRNLALPDSGDEAGRVPGVALGAALTADHVLNIQDGLSRINYGCVLAGPVIDRLRMVKTGYEIEELAAAGAAIDRVHARVPELLQPGRTEAEIAEEITGMILEEGHTSVDFVIVGSGPNGADPHHSFSDRKLRTGELVVVDIGGALPSGYRSDCTRTYLVADTDPQVMTERVLDMYRVLEKAQAAAVKAVRPGVTAGEIDRIAREAISAAGYGEQFIHRTGHGIGLTTHEAPSISADSGTVLEPGMAFSVEPGIYITDEVGARIEDIVVVTDDGVRPLNNRPRSLFW
ncbi:M24 family metallopeptidase [Corynebacterium pygosceleis]|uniref:Xaa-Pro peptidase family protein n=1 Tax=Corynebacterium pygosceleis TaxID=2800406 RepID=A0A9Q4C822_9CORY|nr:Xaa-Pro peptidase family protein [Corynebacterium pygosceleis]MCK7637065.1 Xaa-Pro peptidase family protein [Corynebacterium pygosceleis]MCL0120163.1 Xaa-Pro peptidase family protein [Corynebacterium pygosceleis]MCX7443707.1 Xaa-Pro peptidase family protein [Corynebacterium pygosceleis]MCX7467818.1 Xaa-Pro peptidase family protein [Corynebacterium pygosceleis]